MNKTFRTGTILLVSMLILTTFAIPCVVANNKNIALETTKIINSANVNKSSGSVVRSESSGTLYQGSSISNNEFIKEGTNVSVTLITGDSIVAHNISGNITYSILVSKGKNRVYEMRKSPQGTYFIPVGIDLNKIDLEFFNVDYLIKEDYENLNFIPILISENKKIGNTLQYLNTIDKSVKIVNSHNRLRLIEARVDKKFAGNAFGTLLSPDIQKIWLDKKVHINLKDSVPIIGAPVLWTQGYNGAGIKIGIIDTGIDDTHPDLNDIDDNSITNDPKVLIKKNFVDWNLTGKEDDTTGDLFGHGTHVASIASGTGQASGGLYKGVAPGSNLWNLRVLNQYGSGYESWIIDAINYCIYGPDGIIHSGDEPDIISLSLGDGVTSGDDPMSNAVNAAADSGIIVTIAAGNCGDYCISSPGSADKIITVGATDKSDNLAYFSSRGPTLDYRTKPDVVAPGVDIIAARASGTSMGSPIDNYYTMASGTSMATPHVAGAAALIIQKAKNNIPNWFLENPKNFSTTYNWIDGISGGSSGGIFGDDVSTNLINIGFNFTFFGKNYSSLYFSTNGLITFGNSSASWNNVPIPNTDLPNNFIAPFWDDLYVANGIGNTYYKLDASSNPKKFIITWKNVYRLGYSSPITFEAILFSNGSVLFQYQNISNIGIFDQTIGAENTDGSGGIQFAYSTPTSDGSAIMFVPKVSNIGKPKYVKDVLISTAKDLGLDVYEQGGGRIQVPSASNEKIIADPATVSFKLINVTSSSPITFYNLDTTSSRILNFDLVLKDLSGNVVNAAYVNTNSLTILPNSSASVLLTINPTGIPKGIYSGKLSATADNGDKITVIFGFSYLNELSINKIKFDGSNALNEDILVYRTNVTNPNDYFSRDVTTDSTGIATIGVPDGEYNIWSGGFFNGIWIWTTKDKFQVTSDISTMLDERVSVPVSFDPNKPSQIFASIYSDIYSEDLSHSWGLLYSYPTNTNIYFTPTSDYIDNRYQYYPAAYYNSSDQNRINTPEWNDLYYFEHGINSPKNYVADYSKLVRRTWTYKTASINETGYRGEWAKDKSIYPNSGGAWTIAWLMDLPQQRIEYITPDKYYWGLLFDQNSNWSLSDDTYQKSYPQGSTPTEAWNGQPFSWSHNLYMGTNWLDLYGNVFIDADKHEYNSMPILSNFALYRNGIKIYNLSTSGYFNYYSANEPNTASYSAVIEGKSNQNLATSSKTILNFSYTGSGDYKPPRIFIQIPKLNLTNVLLSSIAELNLSIVDETENGFVNGTPDKLSSLSLDYSTNGGASWNAIQLNSLGNGDYSATIPYIPSNTFVSLRAKAADLAGNSASHELIGAFLVVTTSVPSINVALPNGGENWTIGTTHIINWTSAGNPGQYVKIDLMKGGILNSNITLNTLNNGSYGWTIPLSQTLGSDYKVRVTSTSNPAYTDTSNNNFNIITIPDRLNSVHLSISNYTTRYWVNPLIPVKLNSSKPVGALQFSVGYPSQMINVDNVAPGPIFGNSLLSSNIDNINGNVNIGIINDSGLSINGTLINLGLRIIGNGAGCNNNGHYQVCKPTLKLLLIDLTDPNNNILFGSADSGILSIGYRKAGDANDDGSITASDALLYLRYAVGSNISPYFIDLSDDVTCDNKITVSDALAVLRKAVGQNVNLECNNILIENPLDSGGN